MKQLNISIVLYNNTEAVKKSIKAVLDTNLEVHLYLIDNSSNDDLRYLADDDRITYKFNNENLGYGSAHNIALAESIKDNVEFHLVMNPDIDFSKGTLEHILSYMQENQSVGSLMPKIYYEDGSLQRLCKLLPRPLDLIGRRFLGNTEWAKRQNRKYELHHFDYNSTLNTPCLSGCFMFIRTQVLKMSGVFDPRYFMYLEDYDLNRRINKIARTEFYPHMSVIHGHQKESYKNGRLLKIHVQSAIKYFNKWGWIVDNERRKLNEQVLRDIEKLD